MSSNPHHHRRFYFYDHVAYEENPMQVQDENNDPLDLGKLISHTGYF